ncbi:alpha/beta hydrolase family protein [Nocardioides montaniterrae]
MSERIIETQYGEGRLVTQRANAPIATLLLSHGAGRGIDSPDLVALADELPRAGITVVLFEQPWVRAGRKVASPPATLDVGLRAAAASLTSSAPLVVGGRSAGARSALRCARELGAQGVLAISFPLHPPGKPERSRLQELLDAGTRTLVVQGERDPMGRPEEFPDPLPDTVAMAVVPTADHGLKVPRSSPISQQQALDLVAESAAEWLTREIAGNGPS